MIIIRFFFHPLIHHDIFPLSPFYGQGINLTDAFHKFLVHDDPTQHGCGLFHVFLDLNENNFQGTLINYKLTNVIVPDQGPRERFPTVLVIRTVCVQQLVYMVENSLEMVLLKRCYVAYLELRNNVPIGRSHWKCDRAILSSIDGVWGMYLWPVGIMRHTQGRIACGCCLGITLSS